MFRTFCRLIPGALAGVTLEDALVAKHAFLHVEKRQPCASKCESDDLARGPGTWRSIGSELRTWLARGVGVLHSQLAE
jgi:hypothetical protein